METTRPVVAAIWPLSFWMFVIVKIGGTVFAPWSWWWVFVPVIPVFAEFARYLGWM